MWRVLILILLVFSCGDKDSCGLPDYEKVRKCELALNASSKKGLNSISTISNIELISNEITMANGKRSRAGFRNNIFFDLNANSQTFYFEQMQYDYDAQKLLAIRTWEVPLNELNSDNIEVSEMYMELFRTNVSIVSFTSNFNNPEAFDFTLVTYDEDGETKDINCNKVSSFDITTSPAKANEIKTAFQNILSNLASIK